MFFSFLISRDIIRRQSEHNWNYPCTNLLLSRPGLRGRASISIGPQADAATGLTTGMADQAPLMKEGWRRKESSCSLITEERFKYSQIFPRLTLLSLLELTPFPEERTLKEKKLLLWLTYTITQKDSRFFQLIQIHKQLFVLCVHIGDNQKKRRSHISINQGPILHCLYTVLQVLCCFKGEFAWSQWRSV